MPNWLIMALSVCALCVFLAGVMIPQILLVAFRCRLFDEIDERKIHKGAVPRLGGIAFTPVICFAVSLCAGLSYLNSSHPELNPALNPRQMSFGFCALLLLYIVGMADDLIGIRYRAKFVVQIICAGLLLCGGMCCTDFCGILGFNEVHWWFGAMVTTLMVVFVINAINLIDGIDGLASGLSMIGFLLYGIMFGILGNTEYAMISFAGLGVLIPFFGFNVFGDAKHKKKIFMGDTGALTIGLLLCFLGLALLQQMVTQKPDLKGANPMIITLAPLLIPCLDVVRVFLQRIRLHGNPFLPDRRHIHHKLMDAGIKPRVAMSVLVLTAMGFTLVSIALSEVLNVNIVILLDVVAWIAINVALSLHNKRCGKTQKI